MHRGYVKLWRKSLDNGLLKNHKLWVFWSYCIMKATHKPFDAVVGFKTIPVNSGQFVFGRKKASEDTALTERTIRTCLKFLEKEGNVTIKTTNRYSIISIVNWEQYQVSDQQTTSEVTNKRPANDHIQEHKNKENKDICQPQAPDDVIVKPKIPNCPHTDIINLYHSKLPELAQISTKVVNGKEVYNWSGARRGYLSARWLESERRQSLDWWGGYFDLVRECNFLMGKVGGSTFKANLEWIIKPMNFNKIVEGKYKR